MFFSKYAELSQKGVFGKAFYLIRFALCAFPIGSLIAVIYWAIITASKNWSTIVNNTILILCIIVAFLSIASFVFILFAALSILQKLEKLFTYLYFFITLSAFIVGFALLSFGNSSHEISYLSNFDKACGNSTDVVLTFPTPTIPPPSATPFATLTQTPEPSLTPTASILPPQPNPSAKIILKAEYQFLSLDNYNNNNEFLEDTSSSLPLAIPSSTPLPTPSNSPMPTPRPKNFSDGAFCKEHWTSWSRRKYIRVRTIEAKNIFAGIISPWIIFFCIEFIILLILQPPKTFQNKSNSIFLEENNGLDNNLLPDQQSQFQTHDDNVQLESDPIFKDEDASGENSLNESNV
ncbi:hypothetical protein M9Y10_002037 [Tritrichomonas musculus]|uniref:Tetraspanin family protein n=1 Tax=Tritrichomonas musculus TaxID=1915356 RepID=A0ABR2L8P2_9EUKA